MGVSDSGEGLLCTGEVPTHFRTPFPRLEMLAPHSSHMTKGRGGWGVWEEQFGSMLGGGIHSERSPGMRWGAGDRGGAL